ncbi:hypothetical protein TTHERM_00652600 (macronuclear) [Tetrahymena thermophila SB210]|uniref:Uncharacterized protein n=1 Tax=Tetrahymena thermophila (strain SB210) TaxID=312017 RepID=Q23B18_TETTS|nr:hypothetical protein TTHERM_00652600 [Tetrahymena thermophila SB210]EAR93666.2 hypothetical protein TTHERM_00652600 [Tetrahymena thermophila SB210]|eukprot:XP_001013911.2 hypothetical protein TTHERM_00652600 [Tetrahymena thermophila SB210]
MCSLFQGIKLNIFTVNIITKQSINCPALTIVIEDQVEIQLNLKSTYWNYKLLLSQNGEQSAGREIKLIVVQIPKVYKRHSGKQPKNCNPLTKPYKLQTPRNIEINCNKLVKFSVLLCISTKINNIIKDLTINPKSIQNKKKYPTYLGISYKYPQRNKQIITKASYAIVIMYDAKKRISNLGFQKSFKLNRITESILKSNLYLCL